MHLNNWGDMAGVNKADKGNNEQRREAPVPGNIKQVNRWRQTQGVSLRTSSGWMEYDRKPVKRAETEIKTQFY